MIPQRVRRTRTSGQPGMPTGSVYVGRPSRWGNPFRIYHGHSLIGPPWFAARETWRHIPLDHCDAAYITSSGQMSPADAVEPYRDLLQVRLRDEPDRLRQWLAPLVGRDLACWCPLDQACHADLLLKIANGGAS